MLAALPFVVPLSLLAVISTCTYYSAANAERNLEEFSSKILLTKYLNLESFLFHLKCLFPFGCLTYNVTKQKFKQKLLLGVLNLNLNQLSSTINLN